MAIRVVEPFDVLLVGGRIVDGTGNPWFRADLGIRGDRIVALGPLLAAGAHAGTMLDARGLVVAPGFIDTHVHGDLALFVDPFHEPAIRQGITTYIVGQDGVAMAPASTATLEYMCRYTAGFSGGAEWLRRQDRPTWNSIEEYLAAFDRRSAIHVATLIPNGNLRLEVMGLATRPPSKEELERMKHLLREGMDQGGLGLSSGLDYIPSLYAQEQELTDLCSAMAASQGVYVTHMRRYDPEGVADSLAEVFRIGQHAGVPVHISHFNSQAERVLPLLDQARQQGIEVTYDLYCYLAGSSILGMYLLPAWVQEGGIAETVARLVDPAVRKQLRDWFARPRVPLDRVRLSYIDHADWKHFEGKTPVEAAGSADPERLVDFVCNLLVACQMAAGCVAPHRDRGEEDICDLMNHPAMMAGSDGIFTGSKPHPRGRGCFARYLGHHVRKRTWSLETAVQRLSSHAAQRYGLTDRGLLRPGMIADVVVFKEEDVNDLATFEEGQCLATGMEHVLVNGEVVLLAGKRTTALPGRGLRRGRA